MLYYRAVIFQKKVKYRKNHYPELQVNSRENRELSCNREPDTNLVSRIPAGYNCARNTKERTTPL